MQVELHRAAQGPAWNARSRRQLGVTTVRDVYEFLHQRPANFHTRRGAQAHAAHAHGPSTDVVEPRSAPSVAASTAAASVFSYLGLGSRNTDNIDDGALATDGPSPVPTALGTGEALLRGLQKARDHLGSSLEQLFFDGAAESMPGWDASQMAGVLMVLGLLHRRPDDSWLNEFWSASLTKLHECTTGDLAMLSFGLSELQLRPPSAWREGLLAATLQRAEASAAGGGSGDDAGDAPGLGARPPAGAESVAAKLRSVVQRFVRPAGLWQLQQAGQLGESQEPRGEQRGPLGSGSGSSGRWGISPPVRPINSAYDMEDMYGSSSPETSSSIAEILLGPAEALWGGVRQAAVAVSGAWQRTRRGSELVTVVYNLTAAGLHVEPLWLGRFLEAMRPRLTDLAGDDLDCLLLVAAEEAHGADSLGGAGGWLELSPPWQAALYARVDGINWALQGRHLVGCLSSISRLGLRPPAPWVRRQLLSLQPSLPMLPTPALVQLGTLLPALPLYGATAATCPAPTTSSSPSSSPSPGADPRWFDRWLAEYKSAALERRDALTATDLLAILAGVAAATAMAPPAVRQEPPPASPLAAAMKAPADAAAAALQRLRAGAPMPYSEWRRVMVEAVAERLPQSSLTGLCEAWQTLADAGAQHELRQREQLQGAEAGDAGAAVERDLVSLRELVASRIAVHKSQLSASDVAPVLSSLAAAGLPLPAATLEALLAATSPLLPGLTSVELVTVALSLVRLSYRPNLAWQAAFCSTSRRRLGLMTPGQRCSLLVASASLGLHLPDPWVMDFFAVSERGGLADQLDGAQLANLLWAVSCVSAEPPGSWLEQWEYASMPRLRELGPNMLAVVLKAMSTLHYRPSLAWQSAFFAALQRRLFAAGAAQLTWPATKSDSGSGAPADAADQPHPRGGPQDAQVTQARQDATSATTTAATVNAAASTAVNGGALPPLPASASAAASNSGASGQGAPTPAGSSEGNPSSSSSSSSSSLPGPDMRSPTVTPEALNSLVYSLASLDLAPPAAWLDELMDAVRCKLSLLSTLDLSVVLAYLVARSHRPSDEWWESFLEAQESRFDSLSASEMSSLLVMLNALKVSPTAHWLDAFCAATEARLSVFQPSQLLQVLSCLHLFRHRPGQSWMAAYSASVEDQLPRFSATELARVLMLLDHLNQRPTAGFMAQFYDTSRPGLAQLDTQELVNVAWAVVSCSTLAPDTRWTEALVEAARPRLASLQQPHLRVLVAALGHMQRGSPSPSAENFLAFAREFLLV